MQASPAKAEVVERIVISRGACAHRNGANHQPLTDEAAAQLQAPEEASLLGHLETEELLFSLLRALSPEQRAVMELVYYQGLHYGEIAQVINCPENTVKTRVYHARRKLRMLWPELTGGRAPLQSEIDNR